MRVNRSSIPTHMQVDILNSLAWYRGFVNIVVLAKLKHAIYTFGKVKSSSRMKMLYVKSLYRGVFPVDTCGASRSRAHRSSATYHRTVNRHPCITFSHLILESRNIFLGVLHFFVPLLLPQLLEPRLQPHVKSLAATLGTDFKVIQTLCVTLQQSFLPTALLSLNGAVPQKFARFHLKNNSTVAKQHCGDHQLFGATLL